MVFVGCILLVAVCVNHLAYGAVTKKDEYVPIKYPGPVKEVLQNRYGDVPEECASKNYCTIKPADYPQERFNKLFKGTKAVSQPTLVIDDLSGAPNRHGDPDYLDNCDTVVTYEPLYKVRNSRGWHTVVQAPEENYVQMVRLETCSQDEGPCFTAFSSLPEFKTYCKQKYSVWEFLVLSDDKNKTERFEPLYKVMIDRVWHTVVQAPDMNYVQKVRLETCSHEDGPCFTSFPSLPEIKTYCKQKYSTWEFLVAAGDGIGTKTVESELPVCCSCHYKSVL